ncbi:MAG: 50S ribosomal protein L16 [Candidatus Omnitrophica bacterium]|nr:50S ribosomal protein L16 [Candidatus Omnitrophota bacterium]
MMPKRVKFRKSQRGRRLGTSFRGANLAFGEFGLKALENAYFTDRQIEAARVALMRNLKGGGKVWIRIFPDKPITKKPAETRMGKGKGMPDHWVAVIKKGKVLFEMDGVPMEIARDCMRIAAHKIPLRTKFITRTMH